MFTTESQQAQANVLLPGAKVKLSKITHAVVSAELNAIIDPGATLPPITGPQPGRDVIRNISGQQGYSMGLTVMSWSMLPSQSQKMDAHLSQQHWVSERPGRQNLVSTIV